MTPTEQEFNEVLEIISSLANIEYHLEPHDTQKKYKLTFRTIFPLKPDSDYYRKFDILCEPSSDYDTIYFNKEDLQKMLLYDNLI